MRRLIWLSTLVFALIMLGVGIIQYDRNQGLNLQVNLLSQEMDTMMNESIGMVMGSRDELDGEMVVVEQVIDGDTIKLIDGRAVRYIGIDAPETDPAAGGKECFGEQATIKNIELVEGKTVRLETDTSEVDRYGRLLRYVWLEDEMINHTLVRSGYAEAHAYPPDTYYQDYLDEAEKEAQDNNSGLWAVCGEEAQVAAEDPDDSCMIKGNISRYTGEKIYHIPGGYYYDITIVGDLDGERWFCSQKEARAAGWKKSSE